MVGDYDLSLALAYRTQCNFLYVALWDTSSCAPSRYSCFSPHNWHLYKSNTLELVFRASVMSSPLGPDTFTTDVCVNFLIILLRYVNAGSFIRYMTLMRKELKTWSWRVCTQHSSKVEGNNILVYAQNVYWKVLKNKKKSIYYICNLSGISSWNLKLNSSAYICKTNPKSMILDPSIPSMPLNVLHINDCPFKAYFSFHCIHVAVRQGRLGFGIDMKPQMIEQFQTQHSVKSDLPNSAKC